MGTGKGVLTLNGVDLEYGGNVDSFIKLPFDSMVVVNGENSIKCYYDVSRSGNAIFVEADQSTLKPGPTPTLGGDNGFNAWLLGAIFVIALAILGGLVWYFSYYRPGKEQQPPAQ